MLSQNVNKVLAFLEEHDDLEYNFSFMRLMHKKRVAIAQEHFRRLPIERQRKIIEQAKENMRDELNAFLVEEGLMNEDYLIDEEA